MKPKSRQIRSYLMLWTGIAVLAWGAIPQVASAMTDEEKLLEVRTTGVADYNGNANWAYSPRIAKFVDTMPGLCNDKDGTSYPANKNALGQCIPVGIPDILTYANEDYYELEIVQFREQMHSGLPELLDSGLNPIISAPGDYPTAAEKMDPLTTGGTLLRGYRQTNTTNEDLLSPHNLGVMIVATKDRPVRIKFTNKLPTGTGGDLFIPTDTTVMGSGPGPLYSRVTNDPAGAKTDAEVCRDPAFSDTCFSQNRATLHLHGGHTPWISDGTAHQWITPDLEYVDGSALEASYSKGVSVAYVPDMWFNGPGGATITACAKQTYCNKTTYPNATNNPGPGSQTYYWTNNQSARLLFYHEHAWGITRLGVYAGGVAGYVITDDMEGKLLDPDGNAGTADNLIPDAAHTIPLIIQDKTFVDATTIIDRPDDPSTIGVNEFLLYGGTDPTWIWGSQPGTLHGGYSSVGAAPVTGDLWWPHVYVPAQNPYHPDYSGTNPYGRWHYGPWFWPPTDVPFGVKENPYYDGVLVNGEVTGEQATKAIDPEPPEIPSTPNPSWGAEAFMDTPVVNGTAYPVLNVAAETYRFRILNGAHDRFWNLQLYVAESNAALTEVAMVPAIPANSDVGDPDFSWPTDGREGGVPDPAKRGPAMVQIGVDGGFLPAPVILPNRPVNWNVDVTTFTAGLVLQQNQGGGTLMIGPAERADVIIDFTQFAGKTLILYNDAPAPWPALDPHYDYFTGNSDLREIGGADSTLAGFGPNTRTIMQINVAGGGDTTPVPAAINAVPANLTALQNAFKPVVSGGLGVFANGQDPIIVGQKAYNNIYDTATTTVTFPGTWPNWGVSRITDNAISFKTPEGATVTAYPLEPKAIQDEMGEVYDEFGRMSAKLGLELAKTTAGIQTFTLQNFVDPPSETVTTDQIQLWKITSNGVDTHPVHFHLFDVQLINRVGWDGFIYLPDDNELGWKDVIRVSPLQDTIVALRPVKVPTPFTVPNSVRPLNPAYPIGDPAGFTNMDPVLGIPITPAIANAEYNFGHEYLWHCHILSHEEQDMMRPIVYNASSLLYTLNNDGAYNGIWQWNRDVWTSLSAKLPAPLNTTTPENFVSSGSYAFADVGTAGVYQWNGYDWRKISSLNPINIEASESGLYATFTGYGLYKWNRNAWTKLNSTIPESMDASGSNLYANFTGLGLYRWNGNVWTQLNSKIPTNMIGTGSELYANFTGYGLYQWKENVWTKLNSKIPESMDASGSNLYANFTGLGLYQWNGNGWIRLNSKIPTSMIGSGNVLYAIFNGYGLYQWNGGAWIFLNATPTNMDVSGSVLYANFSGDVSKWEFYSNGSSASWNQLFNSTPVNSMTAGF